MVATLDADPIALLAGVRRGDAAAQAEFFERHKDAVARQIMRMTGDAGWVDDLVQEVFIAAFSRLDSFRGEAAVGTWLHRITVNKVRNAWDSRRRRLARESEAVRPDVSEQGAPDDEIAASQQLRHFYEVLSGLPSKFRDAFVCRVIEELSLEDSSAALGVPISTVSYRARRGEALIAEAMGLEGEEALP